MDDVRHFRELEAERWEAHKNVHELEKEARLAAAVSVQTAMQHLNNVRTEQQADRLQFSQQLSNCLSKDDFRREHTPVLEEIKGMREWRANMIGRIWVIPAVMSLLTLALAMIGIYFTLRAAH